MQYHSAQFWKIWLRKTMTGAVGHGDYEESAGLQMPCHAGHHVLKHVVLSCDGIPATVR
jgi:hypothetical protein